METGPVNYKPLRHIAICGAGLAGQMCLAALKTYLPKHVKITLIETPHDRDADILYGTVTDAGAYAFNLSVGVTEPDVVLQSNTAFSLGTHFADWGDDSLNWMQSFHLPFPIFDRNGFSATLIAQNITDAAPYIISSQMAAKGAFVHPPEDAASPLSRAEYGYQFDPAHYGALFSRAAGPQSCTYIQGEIAKVERSDSEITKLCLTNGERIKADLFIDCTGPSAKLLFALGAKAPAGRALTASYSYAPSAQLGPAKRAVTMTEFGWQSETPLQDRILVMTVSDPKSNDDALAAHKHPIAGSCQAFSGARERAWMGNCLALGQSSGVIDSVSTAPMTLLQRDIQRLLSLIPVTTDMSVEAREYNRRFANDFEHAKLFTRSVFATSNTRKSPYWDALTEVDMPEKLERKITQFKRRGLLVSYDLEPFTPQDWTIMHFGMKRAPQRDHASTLARPTPETTRQLNVMHAAIVDILPKLPPHHIYMAGLKRHLMKRRV